jgi:tRNA (cytidine/uridine-2'-O-)-methyltransferase
VKVVLFQPEIPQNTGNIVRTCALTRSDLLLVRPLGFSTSSRMLKRSGLDYWSSTNIEFADNLEEYLRQTDKPFYFFSKKALKNYSTVSYPQNALLIFGSETQGLPEWAWQRWPEHFYNIPCAPINRAEDSGCLNLSNAVSIVLYEALRQQGFPL